LADAAVHSRPMTLRDRLPSFSPAVRHGIRYGTAASGALWLAYAAGLPYPSWPLITVMMVTQPTASGSIEKGILRAAGTLGSALIAVAIYSLFAQSHLLLAASICVVYTTAVYGLTGTRHIYAWNVFGFTTGIILGDALSGTNPVEIIAFDRASLVILGILAGVISESIFWPVRPQALLRRSLATRISQIAEATRKALAVWVNPGVSYVPDSRANSSPLIEQLALIDQLGSELGVTRGQIRSYSRVAIGLDGLGSAVRMVADERARRGGTIPDAIHESIRVLLDLATSALQEAGDALEQDREPRSYRDRLQNAMTELDEARIANLGLMSEPVTEGVSTSRFDDSVAVISTVSSVLQNVVDLLSDLENGLSLVARDDPGAPEPEPQLRAKIPSFALDPFRLQLALRSGIAVASVFVVMPLMGWSINSIPMLLAYMVASSPTRAALSSTAIGIGIAAMFAWAVSDLSIIYIAPQLGRMPFALIYPLILAGAAGYLMVRFPKLAPIAPLAAMIPILSVFGGMQAPDNVEGPYDTTVIFFTGIIVGTIAQRLLWPRTAAELFLVRAAGQIELCIEMLRTVATRGSQSRESHQNERVMDRLMAASARQLTSIGQFHIQAQAEPVVQALDDGRRARLLIDVSELFEATLRIDILSAQGSSDDPFEVHPDIAPLRSAVSGLDDAMASSLEATVRSLQEEPRPFESHLAERVTEVEARVAELRGNRGLAERLGGRGIDQLIIRLDGRRRVASQALVIERWVENWRTDATPIG
jgi:uncharacterized membrane protein YccC